jgi:hypothetical protein
VSAYPCEDQNSQPNCMSVYERVTFGWTLHTECYGCTLKHPFIYALEGEADDTPVFKEKCPRKPIAGSHITKEAHGLV